MQGDKEGRKKALLQGLLGARFDVEGRNDLQRWINHLSTTHGELQLYGEDTSEDIRIAILTKSLPCPLFDPFNISLWDKKYSYAQIVNMVRQFANNPPIAEKLASLSSLHSKGLHTSMAQGIFALEAKQVDAERPNTRTQASQEQCRNFLRGRCTRSHCQFIHDSKPAAKCVHCAKTHPSEACWTKFPHLKPTKFRKPQEASDKRASVKAFMAASGYGDCSAAEILAILQGEEDVLGGAHILGAPNYSRLLMLTSTASTSRSMNRRINLARPFPSASSPFFGIPTDDSHEYDDAEDYPDLGSTGESDEPPEMIFSTEDEPDEEGEQKEPSTTKDLPSDSDSDIPPHLLHSSSDSESDPEMHSGSGSDSPPSLLASTDDESSSEDGGPPPLYVVRRPIRRTIMCKKEVRDERGRLLDSLLSSDSSEAEQEAAPGPQSSEDTARLRPR